MTRADSETTKRIDEEIKAHRTWIDKQVEEQRRAYAEAGFEVHRHGELKKDPYVDVVAKEAKVDDDFYDHS